MPSHPRLFVLSPADVSGPRATALTRTDAPSPLAHRLRSSEGVELAELFTFVSALYFRGKLEYARAFARPPSGEEGVHVILPGFGLRPPSHRLDLEGLLDVAGVGTDPRARRYAETTQRDAERLAASLPVRAEVVLLGSIATSKYVDPLSDALGGRLRVPRELIGLGMMSRGSLLRRCAREGRELTYVPVPP